MSAMNDIEKQLLPGPSPAPRPRIRLPMTLARALSPRRNWQELTAKQLWIRVIIDTLGVIIAMIFLSSVGATSTAIFHAAFIMVPSLITSELIAWPLLRVMLKP